MWNSYGHEVKTTLLTAALMRSFRGSSDYTGALLSTSPQGWLALHGPWSWTPAPGPRQALRSCVCLKTRLNPPQQLSQIRSQFSTKGGRVGGGGTEAQRTAGADCRADVVISESMDALKVKKVMGGVSKLAQTMMEFE